MTRGQHSHFTLINFQAIVADWHDHLKRLIGIANGRGIVLQRRGDRGVKCDTNVGPALLWKDGGRRGGGVLNHRINQIQLFDVVNLSDEVGVLSNIHMDLGLIDGGDVTLRVGEVNGEGESVKGT
jgi:hypothetical protein